MQPALTTDAKLLGVLTELRRREPIFHRPDRRRDGVDRSRAGARNWAAYILSDQGGGHDSPLSLEG
jgi:hypothetical protein